eukprot:gene20478-27268_t
MTCARYWAQDDWRKMTTPDYWRKMTAYLRHSSCHGEAVRSRLSTIVIRGELSQKAESRRIWILPPAQASSQHSAQHPSACQKPGPMASTVPSAAPSSKDLLVVGPGVLGGYLGKIWKEEHPGSSVTGLTNTDANHARLKNFGFEPHVRQDVATLQKKFPYVVFSAPPTHSEDYAADVKEAMSLWDGSGSFVFTSSMSVCSVDDGSAVQESCPLVAMGAMPNTDKLLAAEEATLQ